MKAPAMATGAPKPAAPFQESAESEGHQQDLQTSVGGDGRDRMLHDFKLAGLHGDVVQKTAAITIQMILSKPKAPPYRKLIPPAAQACRKPASRREWRLLRRQ